MPQAQLPAPLPPWGRGCHWVGIPGTPPASRLGEASVDLRLRTLRAVCSLFAEVLWPVFWFSYVLESHKLKTGHFPDLIQVTCHFVCVCARPHGGSALSGCSVCAAGWECTALPSRASHPRCGHRRRMNGGVPVLSAPGSLSPAQAPLVLACSCPRPLPLPLPSPGSCREGPGPAQWRWGGSNGRLCLGREAAALPLRPCLRHVVSVPVPRSYGES